MRKLVHVDDDPFTRQLVSYVFEDSAVELVSYSCGQACLESLDGVAPDVILLDANLDDMEGAQLAIELNSRQLDIPVVFISGSSEKEIFKNHARTPNVVGIVKKPFIPEDLLLEIESALENSADEHLSAPQREDMVDDLREDYTQHLLSLKHTINEQWRTTLIDGESGASLKEFIKLIHRINGTSGLYRLVSVHLAAEELENKLLNLDSLKNMDFNVIGRECSPMIDSLLEKIDALGNV